MKKYITLGTIALALGTLLCACGKGDNAQEDAPKGTVLLNVSYDPTREFYSEYNKWFIEKIEVEGTDKLDIKQSHGGSGKQARAVIDGLEADVVTLALSPDIDAIAQRSGKIPADWQKKLPNNSCPYTSTIVFLVRKGNPKGIQNWGDLARDGIEVITPNPKTSGGARWNYLAAWAWADEEYKGDEDKIHAFMSKMFHNVPVLDSGARGSTTTFVQRGIGDVLLAWENEAFLAMKEFGNDKFDIVVPPISIKAEPPVAIVEGVVSTNGHAALAQKYLENLYSPFAQALAARHFYRPCHPEMADAKDMARFPAVRMVTIDDKFGGWTKTQDLHFKDGGIFDQIFTAETK
ncbi:MAG: sulfate ABC transporter substrate-binding protein [Opitutales bacterium]|nr:sulfate ABC transporter substrate-binding protein [Opitutales bacterium]